MATLRELRERKLWTQKELAEKVGISPGAIYQMESGKIRRPRFAVWRKIGEVFGVDPLTIEFEGTREEGKEAA